DLTNDLIPVRPSAHYMIGGVTVDAEGRTSVPGLWAAGEATSSGLHGANRLASNSLLEGLYFGKLCGEGASQTALSIADDFRVPPLTTDRQESERADEELNIADLRNALSSLMARLVGIRRDAENLSQALQQVTFWNRYVL